MQPQQIPQLTERKEGSHVWEEGHGERIVVIIDDEYHFILSMTSVQEKPPTNGALGLYSIFRHLVDCPSETRAVGFFHLPKAEDEIKVFVSEVLDWILGLRVPEPRLFFLLDVFLGDGSDNPMGLHVHAHLSNRETITEFDPKYALLSRVPLDIHGLEVPPGCPRFSKFYVYDHPRETLNIDLLGWLGDVQDRRLSDLTSSDWVELRTCALNRCRDLGNDEQAGQSGHPFFAHHLPHGGATPWNDEPVASYVLEQLTEALVDQDPLMRYAENWIWDPNRQPFYEYPSIRSIAQHTGDGRDLSLGLHLFACSMQQEYSGKIEVKVCFSDPDTRHPIPAIAHDYLWFNFSTLARGLALLTSCFHDEVNCLAADPQFAKQKGFPDSIAGQGPAVWNRGRITLRIWENNDSDDLGLNISICQDVLGEAPFQTSTLQHEQRYRLPPAQHANKKVKEARDIIRSSGAVITQTTDQGWLCFFKTRIVTHSPGRSYWEVSHGGDN